MSRRQIICSITTKTKIVVVEKLRSITCIGLGVLACSQLLLVRTMLALLLEPAMRKTLVTRFCMVLCLLSRKRSSSTQRLANVHLDSWEGVFGTLSTTLLFTCGAAALVGVTECMKRGLTLAKLVSAQAFLLG